VPVASDTGLNISVVGPLLVRDHEGRDLTPPGELQRRLLALLVLRRDHVVSADAIIEALWPRRRPNDAAAALQNHVFRLRRQLPDGLIRSVGTGYLLDGTLVEVDVDRVTALVATELGGDQRAELAAILDRWDGAPYPELADTDAAMIDDARIGELRTHAVEALATARLRDGDTEGLAVELTELTRREPLRERPHALLMSTLQAESRNVEALRVYDDFRRRLSDELGIEPSPLLAAQHADLLAGRSAPGVAATPIVPISSVGGHPLPTPTTTLLGREQLVGELAQRVTTSRLVTLVGPGGVGKTRVLVELGHRLAAGDSPVVLCELAASDEQSVADVVAAAVGIDARPGVPTPPRLTQVIGTTHLVLLIDNCEHVLDAVAHLVELVLRSCPGVVVVATSRERLRISGEQVIAVPTLVDDDDVDDGTGTGTGAIGVDLFVDRARDVRPGFEPDEGQLTRIAEIVRRLDGLPLAIELAAARLHTHELEEIADGVGDPLTLLASGFRASSRHASLSSVIEWSYGLLDEPLRRSFDALSAFSRPFTVRDAAAITDRDPSDAAASLRQLVEGSLVTRAGDGRYRLFETLRAFGSTRLAASGRADHVAERHARWMLAWAEEAELRLHLSHEPVIDEVDAAVPELREALDWLLVHGLPDHAARLVAALLNYSVLRLRSDVLGWSASVIDAEPDPANPNTARVWAASGYAAWMSGDVAEAGRRAVVAVELADRGGGLTQEVATMRGNFDLFEGRLDEAVGWYDVAIEVATVSTQRLIAAGARLLALGYAHDERAPAFADELLAETGDATTAPAAYIWYCAGEADLVFDLDRARHRLSRAIELATASNASFVRGIAGASRASIEVRSGDPTVAATDYLWLIPHWRRASMWSTQWTMLRSILELLERLGEPHDAAVLAGAVSATASGHRIFGDDERQLRELGVRLRALLGDATYEAALGEGARLDGDAAADRALRAIGRLVTNAATRPAHRARPAR
jgi:predicted ATPase/DNA-binding SARP family transcriptional activator